MSRPALLDVNVLIALFDAGHVHHDAAHDWFAAHRKHGWATCPITENGFVRVLSHPSSGSAQRPAELLAHLRQFTGSRGHVFWPDALSLRDEGTFDLSFGQGHRQVTDIYLLGLAVKKRGRLATFDRTIPLRAVRHARPDSIAIISSVED